MSIIGPGILFRLRAGGNAPGLANVRANATATYLTRARQVTTAAANTLRLSWVDTNADQVVETPTYLLEPAATNSCLQSQAWATAPWGTTLLTAANNNGALAAPDGTLTASSLTPTAVNSNNHNVLSGAITITSGEFIACSLYVENNGYTGLRIRFTDGTNTNYFGLIVDTSAGTISGTTFVGGAGVLTGSAIRSVGSNWMQVFFWGAVNGGVTSASLQVIVFDTIANANSNTAYTGNGTSGALAWGAQVERNGTSARSPTSHIATTTVTVTRSVDSCTATFPYRPAAMTFYAKYVASSVVTAADLVVMQVGSTSITPRCYLAIDSGTTAKMLHSPGGTVSATVAFAPAAGQIVELRGVLNSDGSVFVGQSIAGAAETVGATSAALAFGADWSGHTIALGSVGGGTSPYPLGLMNALILKGVRSMDGCRALV